MSGIKTNILMKADENSYDIYFYDEIGGKFDWDKFEIIKTSDYLKDKLDEANGRDLNIYVNSVGGEVFEAYSIISMLQRYEGSKTCYIDGMAASCASLIPIVCDKVYVYPYSNIMVHNMWTYAVGNSKELRSVADDLDKFMQSSIDLYMAKFKDTEEKLKDLIDEETWLNADECIEYGFADEKIDSKPKGDDPDKEDKDTDTMMKDRNTVFDKYAKLSVMAKSEDKEKKEEDIISDFFNEIIELKKL